MLAAAMSQLTNLTLTARLSHILGVVSHIQSQFLSTINTIKWLGYLDMRWLSTVKYQMDGTP